MNKLRTIFLGFMLTFASAWIGLALLPTEHYGLRQTQPDGNDDAQRLVVAGRHVYEQNGCVYCHSQQVSPRNFRSDQARGWGTRRTVASDYRGTGRALMGTMRTGPDLANIGVRNPSPQWHFLHLYNPQLTSKGSNMAPFPFLFEVRPVSGDPAAIPVGDGTELLPSPDARALVAYLLSLKLSAKDFAEAVEAPTRE
jgi:cytochrome c oxidase cbb3-type subunit 2